MLVLAISPEGSRLATGSRDGMIRLWDVEVGESRVLEGHQGSVTALGFALGGRALISSSSDRTLRRWMDDLPVDAAALRAFLATAVPLGALQPSAARLPPGPAFLTACERAAPP